MKRNILSLLMVASLLLSSMIFASCAKKQPEEFDMSKIPAKINSMAVSDFKETNDSTNFVKISVRGFGDIVVCLCPETAPETVKNFKKLVSEGFYNGLTFHRVYPGFMIQGGCPNGDRTGNLRETIKGEFSANGIENNLKHIRGVISMARMKMYDTASCQFFIMHKDNSTLDGKYAAFGYVVAGLDVVDKICSIELTYSAISGERTWPVNTVVMEKVGFVEPIA